MDDSRYTVLLSMACMLAKAESNGGFATAAIIRRTTLATGRFILAAIALITESSRGAIDILTL